MLLRIFVLIFIFLKIAQTYAYEIPVIVIAPSKSPQSYATVGSSVSIIDSEELEESDHFWMSNR